MRGMKKDVKTVEKTEPILFGFPTLIASAKQHTILKSVYNCNVKQQSDERSRCKHLFLPGAERDVQSGGKDVIVRCQKL